LRHLYFWKMTLLDVKNVSKQIGGNKIVNNISFGQEALQKMAIAGQSGAGKSTLLKIISGLVQPDAGVTLFNGHRVIGPEEKLLSGHKEIAYLSQHYELHNNYVVKDLVCFQLPIDEKEAMHIFDLCRVGHLLERRTDQLSGGEKQRIALCGLLVKSPRLLILDEPYSNLDLINTEMLKSVLEAVTDRLQITCLLTSHDPYDILSWADQILVMGEGIIVQQGSPQDIYHRPVNEYVAGLFGKYTVLPPELAGKFGLPANGQPGILRPEDFVISGVSGDGVPGLIRKIRFLGGSYEMEVAAGDLTIAVRTTGNQWQVGQEISLTRKEPG